MAQFFTEPMLQKSAVACIVDLTPPTFAGIVSLVASGNGSLVAGWAAGSDGTPPVAYKVFVKFGTSTGLFNDANIVGITRGNNLHVYTLADGSPLLAGATYYVGVRAEDAVGNTESNSVILSAVSSGVYSDSLANLIVAIQQGIIGCALTGRLEPLDNLHGKIENTVLAGELRELRGLAGMIESGTSLVGAIDTGSLTGELREICA